MKWMVFLYIFLILMIFVLLLQGYSMLNPYPNVSRDDVEKIHVGMTKEEVDQALGRGKENFVETEEGRRYTSMYKSKDKNGFTIVYIEYDVNNKVKAISY